MILYYILRHTLILYLEINSLEPRLVFKAFGLLQTRGIIQIQALTAVTEWQDSLLRVQCGFEHQASKTMSACFSTFTSSIFFWLYRQWLNFQPGRSETTTCVTWKARPSQYLFLPMRFLVQSVFSVWARAHVQRYTQTSTGSHPKVLQGQHKAKGWLCAHSWAVHQRQGGLRISTPRTVPPATSTQELSLKHCEPPASNLDWPTKTSDREVQTPHLYCWTVEHKEIKKNYTGTWIDSLRPVKNL